MQSIALALLVLVGCAACSAFQTACQDAWARGANDDLFGHSIFEPGFCARYNLNSVFVAGDDIGAVRGGGVDGVSHNGSFLQNAPTALEALGSDK